MGAAGAFLLLLTLYYTRRATTAAADAARATEKSVDIATAQAHLVEETAERQLRAYIHVTTSGRPTLILDAPIEIPLQITNVGQTPAYNVRHWVATGIGDASVAIEDDIPRPADSVFNTFARLF